MFLFKPFEGVYGSLRLNEVEGSSNRQPDGFPAHLWGDKPPTRGFLPPSNTHTDTQSRYQQHHWCQLQQRGENHRISGFSPDCVSVQEKKLCVLSFLSTVLLLAVGSANLGTWRAHTHMYVCACVCVLSWYLGGRRAESTRRWLPSPLLSCAQSLSPPNMCVCMCVCVLINSGHLSAP